MDAVFLLILNEYRLARAREYRDERDNSKYGYFLPDFMIIYFVSDPFVDIFQHPVDIAIESFVRSSFFVALYSVIFQPSAVHTILPIYKLVLICLCCVWCVLPVCVCVQLNLLE